MPRGTGHHAVSPASAGRAQLFTNHLLSYEPILEKRLRLETLALESACASEALTLLECLI